MPWHLSKSDPRKVYDERHEAVCVCQKPEQALIVVTAVNRLRKDTPLAAEPNSTRQPLIYHTLIQKPDLTKLASEAHGEKPEDCGFAVTRVR